MTAKIFNLVHARQQRGLAPPAQLQPALAAASASQADERDAELREITGYYLSKRVVAALPTQHGYISLTFPEGTRIEEMPFTKQPVVREHASKEEFERSYRKMPGDPAISLIGHFVAAQAFIETAREKTKILDVEGPAHLYQKVATIYEVTRGGVWAMPDGTPTSVETGEILVVYKNGDVTPLKSKDELEKEVVSGRSAPDPRLTPTYSLFE